MENKDLYNLLSRFKTKTEAYQYFGITPNSSGILKLKNLANSVNFDLNSYNEKRKPIKRFCINCENELKTGQRKFCSRSCSVSTSNHKRIMKDETKEKIRKSLTKNKKAKKCNICGQEKCINDKICHHTKAWFNNLACFGFDLNKIGTFEVYDEYYTIKERILKEYFDNNLSPSDMSKKYNYHKKSENILHILKGFGVKTRNLSDSLINSWVNGSTNTKIKKEICKYQFNHGWHTSWDNKKVYYRSSYELMYAKKLDNEKIKYETEFFRIKYWDTQKCKYRVAIPDFYIIEKNTIVEIKSRITFNKQNMIDKFNEYIKMGFIPILNYENTMFTYDEMLNIPLYEINNNWNLS